ncbi:hypothetical protein PR048_033264 [Dryococelus australis]|uniref:Uncharacterized protein n=1 Tax=Dryococelus australis TaxID=614101 RepID=A0ABQ9G0R8_9NEOP|nr:hypothetical protein PR048_033264 [Dryococelus australis]
MLLPAGHWQYCVHRFAKCRGSCVWIFPAHRREQRFSLKRNSPWCTTWINQKVGSLASLETRQPYARAIFTAPAAVRNSLRVLYVSTYYVTDLDLQEGEVLATAHELLLPVDRKAIFWSEKIFPPSRECSWKVGYHRAWRKRSWRRAIRLFTAGSRPRSEVMIRVARLSDFSAFVTFPCTEGGRGGVVVRLLASHLDETWLYSHVEVAPGSSHAGIVPDDAAGSVGLISGISRFLQPCIPALLHTQLTSISSALKTSLLRAAQISPPRTRDGIHLTRMSSLRQDSQHKPKQACKALRSLECVPNINDLLCSAAPPLGCLIYGSPPASHARRASLPLVTGYSFEFGPSAHLAPTQLPRAVIGDPPRPPFFLERCARGWLALIWVSRECRQWRDLLASQTSSHLLEFPLRLATTQECSGETGWCLSPPRRITRVGEDSRWQPKTLYILPQLSGRQSLTEAAWPSMRERNEVWTTTGDYGRRRVRCSWLEWARWCETDEWVQQQLIVRSRLRVCHFVRLWYVFALVFLVALSQFAASTIPSRIEGALTKLRLRHLHVRHQGCSHEQDTLIGERNGAIQPRPPTPSGPDPLGKGSVLAGASSRMDVGWEGNSLAANMASIGFGRIFLATEMATVDVWVHSATSPSPSKAESRVHFRMTVLSTEGAAEPPLSFQGHAVPHPVTPFKNVFPENWPVHAAPVPLHSFHSPEHVFSDTRAV